MLLQSSQNRRIWQAEHLLTGENKDDLKVTCRDDSGQQLTGFLQITGQTPASCKKCSLYLP